MKLISWWSLAAVYSNALLCTIRVPGVDAFVVSQMSSPHINNQQARPKHSNDHDRNWLLPRPTTVVLAIKDDNDDEDILTYNNNNNHQFDDNDDYTDDANKEEEEDDFQRRHPYWILLVDDEEAIRTAVGQLLFDQGFQVTACADGPTALEILSQSQDQTNHPQQEASNNRRRRTSRTLPDAIVTDVNMPHMTGLEFLRILRQDPMYVSIPVVLLTAKGTLQDRVAGYEAGADAYLPKPFDPSELVAICDNVLQQFATLNGNDIELEDLKDDLQEIKRLLLEKGGGGVGTVVHQHRNDAENNNNNNNKNSGPTQWVDYETHVFLAPDEREVLELLCEGLMNKEISQRTFLSTRRVEQLLTSMYRKVNVKNRTELVRWAISSGNVQI